MSSALFVYFRNCSRLVNTNARSIVCSSALKSDNHIIPFNQAVSRHSPGDALGLNGGHRNSWLCFIPKKQRSRNQDESNFKNAYYLMFIPVAIKEFFGFKQEEKELTPEELLIQNIKRSILLIKKGEKEKAEQMLHVALKMAQDQQNQKGITYIYDIMANLAFDNDEYTKAEKLFVDLLRRCLLNGMEQTDNKFIHINLKLAKVYQYTKRPQQCEVGYKYCLDALEQKVRSKSDDEDTVMLWCLALDWYGRFLLEQGRNKEALSYLNRAHDTLVQFGGEDHPQNLLLLNDLGVAHSMLDDETTALEYFQRAVKLGNERNDPLVPIIMINMGLLFLRKMKLEDANVWCSKGLESASKLEDWASEKEAKQCLSAIKKAMKQG